MISKQKVEGGSWRVLLEDKNANRINWFDITRRLSVRVIERRNDRRPSLGARIVQVGRAIAGRYRRMVKK